MIPVDEGLWLDDKNTKDIWWAKNITITIIYDIYTNDLN